MFRFLKPSLLSEVVAIVDYLDDGGYAAHVGFGDLKCCCSSQHEICAWTWIALSENDLIFLVNPQFSEIEYFSPDMVWYSIEVGKSSHQCVNFTKIDRESSLLNRLSVFIDLLGLKLSQSVLKRRMKVLFLLLQLLSFHFQLIYFKLPLFQVSGLIQFEILDDILIYLLHT